MAEDSGKPIGQHLRALLARSQPRRTPGGLTTESVRTGRDSVEAAADSYVIKNVPGDFSTDEVEAVKRKAITEQPLSHRENLIAEAIIYPDLRPAIDIVNGDFSIDHPFWPDYVAGLAAHRAFTAALPMVGRVELPGSTYPYGGTCFVVGDNLLMTNRHVAQLFASGLGDRGLTFFEGSNPGVDFVQEVGSPPGKILGFRKMRLIHPYWDLALVEVEGLDPNGHLWLDPVEPDARNPRRIAVIGYPAFDPRNSVEVQSRVFRGLYNVKRFQPGLFNGRRDVDSFGKDVSSACHDSSTLGGNSGSVVLDPARGDVVGLHFAGVYKDSNFAVAAVDLARDGRMIDAGVRFRGPERRTSGAWDQWWGRLPNAEARQPEPEPTKPETKPAIADRTADGTLPAAAGTSVSVTVPLTITVSLGQPCASAATTTVSASTVPLSFDATLAQLAGSPPEGVLRIKRGFNGRTECIVFAADPARFAEVQRTAPASHGGYPVDVRYATIDEQLGLAEQTTEAPGSIRYDDTRRTGANFGFDPVEETMTVIAHVGPEASFDQLKSFIAGARKTLTSSMYQFFAAHVAEAVEDRLKNSVKMRIVLDPATRDPQAGTVKPGEFDRSVLFEKWRNAFAFENVFTKKGNGGLVDSAYHIKVTVRDLGEEGGDWFWLSSGNWTKTSQPAPDASGVARGNREWHIVAQNGKLAKMFAAHIAADFDQSQELGGAEEAPQPTEPLVDVPVAEILEAPIALLEPLHIEPRTIRVQPLLTPDRHGRVYTDAVLALIASATEQLVFQNQYIKIRRGTGGNLGELVDALIERSKTIRDVRILLRSGDVDDDVAELHRRGMDVGRCVRVIANTHTKGIVADAKRVLIGSQNWSEQAVASNRDASLLFDDREVAGYFLKAFEIDWERARPAAFGAAERPVLAARGPAPPLGYSRMTLAEFRNK